MDGHEGGEGRVIYWFHIDAGLESDIASGRGTALVLCFPRMIWPRPYNIRIAV